LKKIKIKIIKICGLVWVGCGGLWVKNWLEEKADVTLIWLWIDVGWMLKALYISFSLPLPNATSAPHHSPLHFLSLTQKGVLPLLFLSQSSPIFFIVYISIYLLKYK